MFVREVLAILKEVINWKMESTPVAFWLLLYQWACPVRPVIVVTGLTAR